MGSGVRANGHRWDNDGGREKVNGKSILTGRSLRENYQPWQSYPTNHWQSSHRQIEDISLHPEKWMKSVTSIWLSKEVSSINIEMKTFRGLTEFQVDMTISEGLLILNRMFSPNSRKIWTKTTRITPKYTEYAFLRSQSRTEEIRINVGLCEGFLSQASSLVSVKAS